MPYKNSNHSGAFPPRWSEIMSWERTNRCLLRIVTKTGTHGGCDPNPDKTTCTNNIEQFGKKRHLANEVHARLQVELEVSDQSRGKSSEDPALVCVMKQNRPYPYAPRSRI